MIINLKIKKYFEYQNQYVLSKITTFDTTCYPNDSTNVKYKKKGGKIDLYA